MKEQRTLAGGAIAREFLSAFAGLLLIIISFKLLFLTPNLYHSTDFEVHRNWLAITSHEYVPRAGNADEVEAPQDVPFSEFVSSAFTDALNHGWLRDARWWYREGKYSIWTLDYPPLFAFFEAFLARVVAPGVEGLANLFLQVETLPTSRTPWNRTFVAEELQRMKALDQVENARPFVKYFQRGTAILFSDVPLVLIATIFSAMLVRQVRRRSANRWKRYAHEAAKEEEPAGVTVPKVDPKATWVLSSLPPIQQPWLSGMACGLIVSTCLHPVLALVDSVHFQYNALLFCIFVATAIFVLYGRIATSVFLFFSLILAKHLFLYYALGFGVWGVWLLYRRLTDKSSKSFGYRSASVLFLCIRCVIAIVIAVTVAVGPFYLSEVIHRMEIEKNIATEGSGMRERIVPADIFTHISNSDNAKSAAFATIQPMLERMFPFGRGLCHSYWAPNFYPLFNVVDRVWCKVEERKRRAAGEMNWTCPESSINTKGIVGLHNEAKDASDVENVKVAKFASLPSHAMLPDITPFRSNVLVVAIFAIAIIKHRIRISRFDKSKKRQSVLYDTTKRGLSELRVVLWLCYCSAGAFFLFGFHVHEKAIMTVLFPLLLLCCIAFAECVETQRQLRATLHKMVKGSTADIQSSTRILFSQLNYFVAAVRRTRMLLGLVTLISGIGSITVFPLLFELREIPIKYSLAIAHLAALQMIDGYVCASTLRHLEAVALVCNEGTIQQSIQSKATVALRPLLSALEGYYLVFAMFPVSVYVDIVTVKTALIGGQETFFPLMLLSVVGSIGMVYGIFVKGLRVAGA